MLPHQLKSCWVQILSTVATIIISIVIYYFLDVKIRNPIIHLFETLNKTHDQYLPKIRSQNFEFLEPHIQYLLETVDNRTFNDPLH